MSNIEYNDGASLTGRTFRNDDKVHIIGNSSKTIQELAI